MTSVLSTRLLSLASAVLAATALASCSTPPAPPPPPPPPVPTPATFALSPSITQAAAAYEAYMNRVIAIRPTFQSGPDVAGALTTGESYDPKQLLRDEVAYVAVLALQDPAFVAELRNFSVDATGRQQLITAIVRDPNYVSAFRSSTTAAGLAITALMNQGHDLEAAGEAVKQSAYDLQHQAWSTQFVVNRDERLLQAKVVSNNTPVATIDDSNRMAQAADGEAPLPVRGEPIAAAPYPPLVVRGLAIAALAVLGAAGDENEAVMAPMFEDTRDLACLSMAKLNLYQCLAVAKPHYEDIFCLGQHVMMDTAQCLRVSAGVPETVIAPMAVSSTETPYAGKPKPVKKKKKGKS